MGGGKQKLPPARVLHRSSEPTSTAHGHFLQSPHWRLALGPWVRLMCAEKVSRARGAALGGRRIGGRLLIAAQSWDGAQGPTDRDEHSSGDDGTPSPLRRRFTARSADWRGEVSPQSAPSRGARRILTRQDSSRVLRRACLSFGGSLRVTRQAPIAYSSLRDLGRPAHKIR
ncbi:hypothetical protein HPB49_023246 [Dermacentor silvarum]|uniref:Uncharacterized protein n=1 Tax=Dermacentor silvarum TaxID=543639 RepID=A0ACB8E4B3_DERSI|nr:hypothetical protein HPB49_023246 [Dermacentor silvarum]